MVGDEWATAAAGADGGDRKYTITLVLIDAVDRRESNGDIDTYIDCHGVAGLVTALTYAIARDVERSLIG